MKCLVILCVVLLVLTVVSAKKKGHINEEKEKSLKKVVKECQKNQETHVNSGILKKARRQKPVVLPDNYAAHKLCVFKGVGIINEDDTVNLEVLKKRLTKKAKDDQDVETIVLECGQNQQDAKGTATHIDKCLIEHNIDI